MSLANVRLDKRKITLLVIYKQFYKTPANDQLILVFQLLLFLPAG